jgi:hypothetical protein
MLKVLNHLVTPFNALLPHLAAGAAAVNSVPCRLLREDPSEAGPRQDGRPPWLWWSQGV